MTQNSAGFSAGNPASSQTPTAAPVTDPYAELAKAKGLLDQGVITEAEFNTLKAKLLGL